MTIQKIVFIFLFFISFTPLVFATEISADGCFLRENENFSLRIRMQGFDCSLVLSGANQAETYSFGIYNLDPHYFVVKENGEEILVTRTNNEIIFSSSLAPGEIKTLQIISWYTEDDDFYFAAASDTHNQTSVFETITQNIALLNPPFITLSGDTINGSDTNEATNRTEYDQMETVFAELGNEYLMVPGNHDGERIKNGQENFLHVFREYFGDTYYNFDFGNTLFLALSTEEEGEEGQITGDQLSWARNLLQTSLEANKIGFFHRPLVLPAWNTAVSFTDETNRQEVLSAFDADGMNLAVSGHIHTYEYSQIGTQLMQLITGNAGYLARSDEDDYHFTLMHVSGNTITPYPIETENFSVSVDYSGKNDGTEDEQVVTLTNNATSDLPYIRTKFIMMPGDKFYAFDDQGDPLNFYTYNFGDSSVVYVETALAASSSKIITVERSKKIHLGRTNSVSITGEVLYSANPIDNSSALDFSVIPSSELEVNVEQWDTIFKWSESSVETVSAVYTLQGLFPNRRYRIYKNNNLEERFITDSTGTLIFTLSAKGERTIKIKKDRAFFPNELFMMPASLGTGQVRGFNKSGSTNASFFVNQETGNFQSIWLDADGDEELELAILGKGEFSLYSDRGEKRGSKKVLHKQGSLLKGDFDNDARDEVVFVPKKKEENVKIYSFDGSSWIYRATFKAKNSVFQVGDVDGNDKDELVVSTGKKIKIYRLKNKKLKLIASRNISSEFFTLGDTDGDSQKEIITLASGKTQIYTLKNYHLKEQNQFSSHRLYYGISAGDINGDAKDDILLVSNDRIYIYREKNDRFESTGSLVGFSEGTSDVAFVDFDGDWDLEVVVAEKSGGSAVRIFDPYDLFSTFSGYASAFTGGVNLTKM